MDTIPPELFLESYPPGIREAANALRRVVRIAVPDAVERVRIGWRLIGYEVPVLRGSRYFAYVAPETIHVHLGFEFGVAMADPDRLLQGAHLGLKQVRFLTFTDGQAIPETACIMLSVEAARVARLSREERLARTLDRDWGPGPASRPEA